MLQGRFSSADGHLRPPAGKYLSPDIWPDSGISISIEFRPLWRNSDMICVTPASYKPGTLLSTHPLPLVQVTAEINGQQPPRTTPPTHIKAHNYRLTSDISHVDVFCLCLRFAACLSYIDWPKVQWNPVKWRHFFPAMNRKRHLHVRLWGNRRTRVGSSCSAAKPSLTVF